MKAIQFLMFFLFACYLRTFECWAKTYPWEEVHPNDFQVVSDILVEAEIRLEWIRNAKTSIDLVIFDQRTDPQLGMPVLNELRKAADRGVRVRFLTSWVAHATMDPFDYSGRYLLFPPTQVPIEFLVVGGPSLGIKGWGLLDGIHEKLLIVDQRLGMVTGRGHGIFYLNWMDTAAVFKGKLMLQAQSAYDALWNTVQQINHLGILQKKMIPAMQSFFDQKNTQSTSNPIFKPLNQNQINQVEYYQKWSMVPAGDPAELKPHQRYRIRLIHHELLRSLKFIQDLGDKNPFELSYENRSQAFSDPIIDEMIQLISHPKAQELKIFTLLTSFVPKFKEALYLALGRGLKVKIFTNSKEAHSGITPGRIPVGWYAAISEIDELLQNGVEVIGIAPRRESCYSFMHRKIAILDDQVFFGSHNFNYASSTMADEMSFEIQSQSFADQMRDLFDADERACGEKMDSRLIRQEKNESFFQQWLCQTFKYIY